MGFSVKAWRVARGMTQTELAEALGITSRSVISLEQGPETPLATRLALQAIEDGWRDHGERAGE
jgi:DNA-binding XRE family transcriptional regulator